MKDSDNFTKTQDSSKNAENTCAEDMNTHTLSAERLSLLLNERRNRLRKERSALLQAAERMKEEIAAYDELLAELTT